jgi:hypothetical protein
VAQRSDYDNVIKRLIKSKEFSVNIEGGIIYGKRKDLSGNRQLDLSAVLSYQCKHFK